MLRGVGKNTKTVTFFRIEDNNLILTINHAESNFSLRYCDNDELLRRRLYNLPTFIIKKSSEILVAEIPNQFSPKVSTEPCLNTHLCADCKFCRAIPKEMGGCSKVKDCSIEAYLKNTTYRNAVEFSKRIEKYDFIKYGYEVFGVKSPIFCVMNCEDFAPIGMRREKPIKEVMDMKLQLSKQYDAYFHSKSDI